MPDINDMVEQKLTARRLTVAGEQTEDIILTYKNKKKARKEPRDRDEPSPQGWDQEAKHLRLKLVQPLRWDTAQESNQRAEVNFIRSQHNLARPIKIFSLVIRSIFHLHFFRKSLE